MDTRYGRVASIGSRFRFLPVDAADVFFRSRASHDTSSSSSLLGLSFLTEQRNKQTIALLIFGTMQTVS